MSIPTPVAVLVVAVVAFLASAVYYGVLGSRLAALAPASAEPDTRPAALIPLVELVRNLVLGSVCAILAAGMPVGRAALLALLLWVGFAVVLLTGSVFHERVRPMLAAIHAGDWLIKLALIVVGVGLLA